MDHIKEEIEEFKLERFCDVSIHVDGVNDDHFNLLLHDQNVKLEKQDLIYDLKDDRSEIEDKGFQFISESCVKEELDADSHAQVMNDETDSTDPFTKEECKLSYGLLEEKTSNIFSKSLDVEESDYQEYLSGSNTQFEEELHNISNEREENISDTPSACDGQIKSLQKLTAPKDVCAFECTVCKKSFHFKSHLIRHIETHTNNRPYRCDICNKSYQQKGHFNVHLLTHKDIRPFQCGICNKSFKQKTHFTEHLLIHKDSRPFKCDICNKSFRQKYGLKRHLLTHSDSRPFQCKICNKSFKLKTHFNQHLLIHKDIRPFKCDICKKCFQQKYHFIDHFLIHTNNHPFKCEICNKSFRQKSQFNVHSLTHTNSRPFVCEICNKSFRHKCSLKTHMLTHSDGRPFL